MTASSYGQSMDTAAETDVASASVTIVNERGLHARAAARLVKALEPFDAELEVGYRGESVSGRSIMGLLMLGAGPGCPVLLSATGAEASAALDAARRLIERGFDEE